MQPTEIISLLCEKGFSHFFGVPDSTLSNLIDHAEAILGKNAVDITPNEGSAVAVAAGHFVATRNTPVVFMQNSGLGNAINPIVSMVDESIFDIPLLFLIGWRGMPTGKQDEPQHSKQGAITEPLLRLLGIDYLVVSASTDISVLQNFLETSGSKRRALLIEPGAIDAQPLIIDGRLDFSEPLNMKSAPIRTLSRQFSATRLLAAIQTLDHSLVLSTTGKLTRELYQYAHENRKEIDFLMNVGAMGHAASLAAGITYGVDGNTKVFCFDGDGALLMHMGVLPYIVEKNMENFTHIIFNNGTHESVGGAATASPKLNFSSVAKACGYKNVYIIKDSADLIAFCDDGLLNGTGPNFVEIQISSSSSNNLPRPIETPKENLMSFQRRLGKFSENNH